MQQSIVQKWLVLFSSVTCYRVHSWVSQSGQKVRLTWGDHCWYVWHVLLTELDMEMELCDGKEPLANPDTGQPFNCADEACPSGSYCHRVPHQPARCCSGGLSCFLYSHSSLSSHLLLSGQRPQHRSPKVGALGAHNYCHVYRVLCVSIMGGGSLKFVYSSTYVIWVIMHSRVHKMWIVNPSLSCHGGRTHTIK